LDHVIVDLLPDCPTILAFSGEQLRKRSARSVHPLERRVRRRRRLSSSERLTDNGGVAKWWRELGEVFRSIPAALRNGRRFGRIFRLRDKGRLEDALREALALADELLASPLDMDRPSVIVVASTIDEIAQRLDRPEAAYDVLTRAVRAIEQLRAELGHGSLANLETWSPFWSHITGYSRTDST
jgi:hypothetical protein